MEIHIMKEEIAKLLPQIAEGKLAQVDIEAIIAQIKAAIKADPSNGKTLGHLLMQLKQAQKNNTKHTPINWVKVKAGYLAIGHKPGGKISFEGLQKEGTTVVLTLLQTQEGATDIGKQLQKVDINWIWFSFSAAKPHEGEAIALVKDLFKELEALLATNNRIYIHCSAGIHRTGMITYGLLRFLGMTKSDAFKTLEILRTVTAKQVGEERLIWGDQFSRSTD